MATRGMGVRAGALAHCLPACHAHQLISRCVRGGGGVARRARIGIATLLPPTAPRKNSFPPLLPPARRASPSPASPRPRVAWHGGGGKGGMVISTDSARGNRVAPGLKKRLR
jgi:hypothetical protein